MNPENLYARLTEKFPDQITLLPAFRGETSFRLENTNLIIDLCLYLKKECGFDYLVDISSVDNFGEEPRFEVVYEFYSYGSGKHLRIKTSVSEDAAELPSVISVYKTADWHEREIYDMMGIRFSGHPNLCRILMWEGYPYYPLRKDFPLEGLASEAPDGHFSRPAPMEGGPFVTVSADLTQDREPRSKTPN